MIKTLQIITLLIAFFSSSLYAQRDSFTANDFSSFLEAAYIADATYKTEDAIKSVLSKQGYELQVLRQVDGYSVAFIIAINRMTKHQLIAVRGTSNIENAVVDVAFVLVEDKITGIDIHQGFLLSARDIYEQVRPLLEPGYKINTIGHSLGGATALILAMMLDAQGYNVDEVITFGQPKVTNITGSQTFKHLNVKRLVTPKDMVPLVPPVDPVNLMDFSIFWHQGTEVFLYSDQRYAVLTGMNSMLRAASFLNDVPSEQHLSHHFMSSYIEYLKPKLENPIQVEYKNDFSITDWFGSSNNKTP